MAEPHEPGSFLEATPQSQPPQSQPAELARLLSDDSAERAARGLRGAGRIFLTGTGTSHHGALTVSFAVRKGNPLASYADLRPHA